VGRNTRAEARWYAPLLEPVLSPVSRALERVALERDPWTMPRTGLGGALVLQVSRGFGARARGRAEQAVVAAVEGYNHRLHLGEPDAQDRARWLARDLRWAHRAWRSLSERDEPTLARVVDRLFGPHGEVCDHAIPEAVLFLRGAVAAGVVLGEVSDATHQILDEHATWLGLSWEARAGSLDAAGWQGGLEAVGLCAPFPAMPEEEARTRANATLRALPPSPAVGLFEGALELWPGAEVAEGWLGSSLADSIDSCGKHEPPGPQRIVRAWMPVTTPALGGSGGRGSRERPGPTSSPTSRPTSRPTFSSTSKSGAGGPLEALHDRWRGPIEDALRELTASRSKVLGRATTYLQDQGGKRVRPLLTLAAAEACGGDPRRALSTAAAVEWLHQGSLVLDDIIDLAELRRGHRALHSATTEVFATGVATFVLGRVLRASQAMHPEIRRQVVDAALALAEGERLELLYTGDTALSLTRYYAIIEAKTARLFGCAAAVGALCADAPRARIRALARFGRELGLGFQIIDDLLDYEGDASTLGKRPGTDLRAAKLTLPLLMLRDDYEKAGAQSVRRGGAEGRPGGHSRASERCDRLFGALGDGGALPWIQAELRAHDIPARCRAKVAGHSARALEALSALPLSASRSTLEALASELGARRC